MNAPDEKPWKHEIQQLQKRSKVVENLAQKPRRDSRLHIRQRIAQLVDTDSFNEIGPNAGSLDDDGEFVPANYVLGVAAVNKQDVVVGGEDFTVRGGSPTVAGLRKSVYAEDLALQLQIPLVRLHEGAGGSVAGASGDRDKRPPRGEPVFADPRFLSVAKTMGQIPVASAALGAVAGLPAARLVSSHFSVMTQNSQVLVAGPAVVQRALQQDSDKNQLGGHDVHLANGVVQNLAVDELDAFAQITRFLSYMPPNSSSLPSRITPSDNPKRTDPQLDSIVPHDRKKPYKMRTLIRSIFDHDSFFETSPSFGRGIITGFARLDGRPVGVFANDCFVNAGAMTAHGAEKLQRFVNTCASFHLPVITLVDEPGFMIGQDAERSAVIRKGAAVIAAVMLSNIPWASIHVRKAFGVAAAAHFAPNSYVLAWPSAEQGALPVEGGVAVAFRREIAKSDNPAQTRANLEQRLAASQASALARADNLNVHDVIPPSQTRPALCRWLNVISRSARNPRPHLTPMTP